ncbi:hypothetical protein M595_5966 [Lyngbya aestuarii BL J]|uniref:DUF3727 domain-containing protein n=1 Tax=Lyngbya aestuarii BL J TaxID=1348334 RepID=U7QBH9_9CYAN|nr:DUF3727 domain-containing protein [Lyngbya aestuarii]ERT04091.1 hypothetical protein M595_5966 [Lyngbya aestuarii BL J]
MMFSSQSPQENGRSQEDIVTLTDEQGRSLNCMIQSILPLEGQDYLLLVPVDAPVEILRWPSDDEDEETPIPVESEAELDQILPLAQVVLEEQNLTLKRTAVTFTVGGELPEVDPDDLEDNDEDSGEGDYEEMIELANFYCEEQEYGIYMPVEPFFILARQNERGEPQLLSSEELQRIEPLLPLIEDQLFDDLD